MEQVFGGSKYSVDGGMETRFMVRLFVLWFIIFVELAKGC